MTFGDPTDTQEPASDDLDTEDAEPYHDEEKFQEGYPRQGSCGYGSPGQY